jgi:hypothetical protein
MGQTLLLTQKGSNIDAIGTTQNGQILERSNRLDIKMFKLPDSLAAALFSRAGSKVTKGTISTSD